MIFNSNRAGRQPDNKGRSVIVRPGSDIRSGSTTNKTVKSTVTPTGKRSRQVIVVDGRIKVG